MTNTALQPVVAAHPQLGSRRPELVTVAGYERKTNGIGNEVLKLFVHETGKTAAYCITLARCFIGALMTDAQYEALPKQTTFPCDVDLQIIRVPGLAAEPYRIKKVLRGSLDVPKDKTADKSAPGWQELPGEKQPQQTALVTDEKPVSKSGLSGTQSDDPQDNIDTFQEPTAPPASLNPEIFKAGIDLAHGAPAEKDAARERLAGDKQPAPEPPADYLPEGGESPYEPGSSEGTYTRIGHPRRVKPEATAAPKQPTAETSAILPRFWAVVGPLFEVVGLKDEARLAFIHKALCVEHLNAYKPAKVDGKEAITNAAIHDVMAGLRAIYPNAFLADGNGALAIKSDPAPTSQPEATPEPPRSAVEITTKEDKSTMTPPGLTEASVIVFAKSDIFLTLPNGGTVTLSVTLRDGAQFEEVKRLIDVYKQMLSLPGIGVSRPVTTTPAQPAVPTPQTPATPVTGVPQTAPTNGGERISKLISGVKVAFDEKGQKNLQLFGKYGDNWGTGPDHTCRKAEEMAQAVATAGVDVSSLTPGEIFAVPPFTVSWTKGKETKPNSGRYYHDNPTFARN